LCWAIEEAAENVALRLAIGPSPRTIDLPEVDATPGRGTVLREGSEALLFAYGPVMLHEALGAAEALEPRGVRIEVVNMPWLNRVDADWLTELVEPFEEIFVLEDHAPVGALGDALLRVLNRRPLTVFGVEGWPACGTPIEALRFHGLDGSSLADRIAVALRARTAP
jgi:transketolase